MTEAEIDPECLQLAQEVYANAPVTDIYTDTDDGNALRLIAVHGDQFRRIADMKRWHVWDGMRWAMDYEDRRIREAARDLARGLPGSTKEERAWKHYVMGAAGVSNTTRMAETDRRISILAEDLDSWPELLNTPSGIVDLRTGLIYPHEPQKMLSRLTAYPVDFGPHPLWDRFLNETFGGDQDMIGYIKRLYGEAGLGFVRDHILPFLHGTGANGKGVTTLVLQGLLGDADAGGYAVSAPDGFLMAGREGKHETEMARLRGARLVVCSEQTSGKRFDEAKVKRLTGGDMLTGRFMRGDFFDFTPSHLVWVMSNHLPEVREGGPSFWRRVRRIPFNHVVADAEKVDDLDQLLLQQEGPQILGWLIQGAVEVLAGGLQEPAAVMAATEEYKINEDSVAGFVRDECMLNPHAWIEMSKLRDAYNKHCEDAGIEPISTKALGSRLRSEYGVTEGQLKRPHRKTYKGIGLMARDDDDDD